MLREFQWQRLRHLQLLPTAQRLATALRRGPQLTARPGEGETYYDHRPYSPGEDASRIDWKAFGRTDRLYIRRQQRASERRVLILLDATASMHFTALDSAQRSERPSKLTWAATAAAVLAAVAVQSGDAVELAILGPQTPEPLPPNRHHAGLQNLCRQLEKLCQSEPTREPHKASARQPWPTHLSDGLESLAQKLGLAGTHRHAAPARRSVGHRLGHPAVAILLSDALEPPNRLIAALAPFRGPETALALLTVLSPDEWRGPNPTTPSRLREPETRHQLTLAPLASPRQLSRDYQARLDQHHRQLDTALRRLAGRLLTARTDQRVLPRLQPLLTRHAILG